MVLAGTNGVAQTAANYPSKPVKVVVGYAPGGAVDVVARTLGQSLSAQLGQSFVVENKPGAGTNIAVKSVISAEADGYTLMLAANALAGEGARRHACFTWAQACCCWAMRVLALCSKWC
jgi:tripartite-type tricarboxylate transporter receptor subunit TctC